MVGMGLPVELRASVMMDAGIVELVIVCVEAVDESHVDRTRNSSQNQTNWHCGAAELISNL
jgi:hypothetical protein